MAKLLWIFKVFHFPSLISYICNYITFWRFLNSVARTLNYSITLDYGLLASDFFCWTYTFNIAIPMPQNIFRHEYLAKAKQITIAIYVPGVHPKFFEGVSTDCRSKARRCGIAAPSHWRTLHSCILCSVNFNSKINIVACFFLVALIHTNYR